MAKEQDESPIELTEDEIEEAERIAVPSGDITGALTGAIEDVVEPSEHDQDDKGNRR
jgi:hypothetical protein